MAQAHLPLRIVLALVAAIHIVIGLVEIIPGVPLSYVLVFYGGALRFSPLMHTYCRCSQSTCLPSECYASMHCGIR
jgi:membrane-associated PAP2 superfamily phosphatase